MRIITVTPENVAATGIYCIKDKKAPGFSQKVAWFKDRINAGLVIKIAVDEQEKQLGFIEYLPAELAWRPINATNCMFVQCIALFGKNARGKANASALLTACEADAVKKNKAGICAMSSEGAWMANRRIYEKNGFIEVDQRGRFELMYKALNKGTTPAFYNWEAQQVNYKGWHLVYADQCPWHEKSVQALTATAQTHGIALNVKQLTSPSEAQQAPSGFGTFSLLKDGKLLADHYISNTRFKNILKQGKTRS